MKKVLNILIWLGIAAYLFVALSFAADKEKEVTCTGFNVIITDSLDNNFVSKEDVLSLMANNEMELLGYQLNRINTKDLEELLNNRTVIKHAEIYKTLNGLVNIKIQQRKPIVRVYNRNNHSYYIDIEGNTMPLSNKFTSHVIIANGYISEKLENQTGSIRNCSKLIDKQSDNILCDIYELANFIHKNPFWRSQLEQIYVTPNQEFELIPRVGAHIIEFGDISDMEYKFKKLKALYDRGFHIKGWNDYNRIDLKYSNQVICSKK